MCPISGATDDDVRPSQLFTRTKHRTSPPDIARSPVCVLSLLPRASLTRPDVVTTPPVLWLTHAVCQNGSVYPLTECSGLSSFLCIISVPLVVIIAFMWSLRRNVL